MENLFRKNLLIPLVLLSFAVLYSLKNIPHRGQAQGLITLKGKVVATSFKGIYIVDSQNRKWKVYTNRGGYIYTDDIVSVKGFAKGWKIYAQKVKIRRNFLQKVRVKIHSLLKERFLKTAKGRVAKKLGSALFFGENWFSYKERQKLAHLGVYHLIVISGFHYALFLAVLFLIPVRFGIRYWVAFLFFLFFTFFLLFPKAPTYRAFFSVALFITAKLLERQYNSLKALCFAASVSLLLYPHWLLNVGFWLSYLASLSLILYYGFRKTPEEDFVSSLFGKTLGLEATLVVFAVISPLIVSCFHFFSFGEFIFAPLFTFIVQLYLLVGTLNLFTFWSISPLVGFQNQIASLFGEIFYSVPDRFYLTVSAPFAVVSLVYTLLALGVLLKSKRRKLFYLFLLTVLEISTFLVLKTFTL